MAADPIPFSIAEDFEVEFKGTRKNTTTGVTEAAAGFTTVTARFALTRTGSAIGSCSVTLTERGSTGIYYGTIDKATLSTDLAAYVNRTIYLIVSKPGDADYRWVKYLPLADIESD